MCIFLISTLYDMCVMFPRGSVYCLLSSVFAKFSCNLRGVVGIDFHSDTMYLEDAPIQASLSGRFVLPCFCIGLARLI